jgi:hypothetical protein
MNGAATRIGGPARGAVGQRGDAFAGPGRLPPPGQPLVTPTGKALVEGYRQDIISGFEKEKPRFNPVRVMKPLIQSVKPALEYVRTCLTRDLSRR